MGNEVNIILSAIDDASKVFGKGIGSLTDLKSAVDLAKMAFKKLDEAYKDTVGAAIEGAMSQKDLALQMGSTVEEAGVLREVMDDLRVNQSTLTMAFKNLNQNGLQPNLETLIELAKKYQALPDSVSKNKFAVEMFGRAGVDMQKVLATDVTELHNLGVEALATGEILTTNLVEAMDNARKMAKDLGDSWKGLKAQFGAGIAMDIEDVGVKELIQIITKLISTENEWVAAGKKGIVTMDEANLISTSLSFGIISVAEAQELLKKRTEEYQVAQDAATQAEKDAIVATTDHLTQVNGLNLALPVTNQIMSFYAQRAQEAALETVALGTNFNELSRSADDVSDATKLMTYWEGEAARKFQRLTTEAEKAKKRLDGLFSDVDLGLDTAIENAIRNIKWKETGGADLTAAFAQVSQDLADHKITEEQALAFYYNLIIETDMMKVKLGEITPEEAAKNISENLKIPLQDARNIVLGIHNDLNNLKDKSIYINIIETTYHRDVYGMNVPPSRGGPGGKPPAEQTSYGGAQVAFYGATFNLNSPLNNAAQLAGIVKAQLTREVTAARRSGSFMAGRK